MSIIIRKTRILGTNYDVYSAWEPSSATGNHGTITHIGEQCYGRIGTSYLPPEIDALPALSKELEDAVDAFHEEQYQRAYSAILAEYPEVANGKRDMGEIEVTVE